MIQKKDLGRLEFIAEGGVGRVYRAPDFRLSGHPALAYKELRPDLDAAKARQTLDAMTNSVKFRAGLSPADRDDLDEYSTWPLDMVEDGGTTCGLVMPLIPRDFFLRTRPQTGPAKDVVFELSWLCAKDSQAQVEGIDRSAVQDVLVRLALLAQLVYAVGRLHKHGAVYGDVSLKNAALAVNKPRVKLLDCDAAAALTDRTRDQLHSPFFKPPEMIDGTQKLQDTCTDVYKLGLCIIRGLQQGPGISQTRDPLPLARFLDAQAVDTIARAVGKNRDRRPAAKELFECLERNLLAKVAPPVLHSATLSRTAMLRGQDVEVVWAATGGKEVRIRGANGLDVALPDPGTAQGRHVVTPVASGDIVVEVGNAHATVGAVAGTVTLYDLPQFSVDLGRFPRPRVPQVPPVAIPAVLSALPTVPAVSTATHPVPRPVLPSLEPVAEAVSARTVLSPFERIDTAVADAARAVRGSLDPDRGQADLGAAAAGATKNARAVLDDAWQDLRDRAARQRSARRQPKGTP